MSDELKELQKRLKDEGTEDDGPKVHPLKVRDAKTFKLTAGELRKAIEANPEHPKSKAFTKAVRGIPAVKEIIIERVDLEALLDDKEVDTITRLVDHIDPETNQPTGDKVKVETKKIGKPRNGGKKATAKTGTETK